MLAGNHSQEEKRGKEKAIPGDRNWIHAAKQPFERNRQKRKEQRGENREAEADLPIWAHGVAEHGLSW